MRPHDAGADGDDTLEGGDGADKLFGQDGVDTISGGAGDDRIFGEGESSGEGDTIACGDGYDVVYAYPEPPASPGPDCEARVLSERPDDTDDGGNGEGGGNGGGGGGAVNAPGQAATFLASVRARVAPVKVLEQDLALDGDTIAIELECLPPSLDREGRLTLVQIGGRELELGTDDFRCNRLGRMTVELEGSPKLANLLEGGETVRARLVIRMRGRTVSELVTITEA